MIVTLYTEKYENKDKIKNDYELITKNVERNLEFLRKVKEHPLHLAQPFVLKEMSSHSKTPEFIVGKKKKPLKKTWALLLSRFGSEKIEGKDSCI